jgi:uncharacterized iron-regulated membrane protein
MNFWQLFMHQPRRTFLRRALFQIHLYAGIVVALYAIVIGVTGSALVFQPQIRAWHDRGVLQTQGKGPRISVDDAVAAVHRVRPEFMIMSIRFPASEHDTYLLSSGHMGGHQFSVDPYSGRVIAELQPPHDFLSWLQELHFNLLGGKTGRLINGLGAAIMLLLAGTGIVIWWPGKVHWRRALSVSWKSRWKRINYDLHNTVGFFTLLFLLVIAATGMYYSWPKQVDALLIQVSHSQRKAAAPVANDPGRLRKLPLSELLVRAQSSVPGAWPSMVMTGHGRAATKITLMSAGPRQYQYSSYVYLDPWRGDILRVDGVQGRSWGDTVLAWIPVLHFGTFGGGAVVYVAWMLLGLTPVLLGVSGLLMWWNRVLSKQIPRAARTRKPAGRIKESSVTV